MSINKTTSNCKNTNKYAKRNFIFFALILLFNSNVFAQVQLLKGGNMENKADWHIYNQGSATPAITEFNYTASKPTQGVGGCLRVTSTEPTNVLLWQKFTVKAGETYTVDGAIKTNNVASFWAEISVSLIGPTEGIDYMPNNNGDVVQGFSTWAGCGPSVDALFSSAACTGKKSFVVPGAAGSNVDIYFCLKTGSMAKPLPNPLEIYFDELKLTRPVNTGCDIVSVVFGSVMATNVTIPTGVTALQLKTALTVSPYSTFKIVNALNGEIANQTVIDNTMKIMVTAENGSSKTYSILATMPAITTELLFNYSATVSSFSGRVINLAGGCGITITNAENPLPGSMLNLLSEDVWIYFPTTKPSIVYRDFCKQILVNGAASVVDQNIRVEEFLEGTMVISHPITYKALRIFSGENLSGDSLCLTINTYHRSAQLATFDNASKSFRLKKGYMATLAQNDDGTGISQVYIAYDKDIVVNVLPKDLYDQTSFIRVLPWRWVGKKGWTNGIDAAQMLGCKWWYDWDNAASSTLDVEYVPMRHDMKWNAYSNINNKLKCTHSLGLNEPDRTDQANTTVATALSVWPEMMKSGLRVGSPSPSDASSGTTWLFEFMDSCKKRNYRVDFIPVHWYKGGQSATQFYNWLKWIHDRTGKPIWITEWNNGANWTCCKPTYAQQATAIREMINMMDTTSFVERYSLYEWVEDTRMMFSEWAYSLTPAGNVYQGNDSPFAYNPNKSTVATILTIEPTHLETKTLNISLSKGWNLLSVNLMPDTTGIGGRDRACSVFAIFNGLDVLEIKTMDAFWRKGQADAFNSLKTITPGDGYLVNMNADGMLMVTGTPIIETQNFASPQQTSWQLIGCPYQTATPFSKNFNSTNCTVIKNFSGFWKPVGTTNSIEYMEPGKGYFVLFKN